MWGRGDNPPLNFRGGDNIISPGGLHQDFLEIDFLFVSDREE